MAKLCRILIVEDENIRRGLETTGYLVCVIAVMAVKALLQAKRLRPDLAFLDINLGGRKSGIPIVWKARARD